MKTKNNSRWIFMLAFLLTATLIFSACKPSAAENVQEAADDQQNEIYIPVAGSDSETEAEVETEPEEVAYPDSEQEIQSADMADASQAEAYPDPEEEAVSEEPDPTSEVEPTRGPQPTPRGDELYASSPANFNLASGQVQLVELFAFW